MNLFLVVNSIKSAAVNHHPFLAYFLYFEKIKKWAYEITLLSVCLPLLTFENKTNLYETWYLSHGI
jgi:hypothetical protein